MRRLNIGILITLVLFALVAVASALPATISASVTATPSGPTYFKVITHNGDSDLVAGLYPGWCIGYTIHGGLGGVYMTKDSRTSMASMPLYISSTQWKKVNWILNNPNKDWRITQAAMWKVDGASGIDYPTDGAGVALYNHAKFDSYMTLVNGNGSYVPHNPGEKYAVILYKNHADGTPAGQPLIIPGTIPDIPSPEFPSLALPIAMIIGVAGAVEYVRSKKE